MKKISVGQPQDSDRDRKKNNQMNEPGFPMAEFAIVVSSAAKSPFEPVEGVIRNHAVGKAETAESRKGQDSPPGEHSVKLLPLAEPKEMSKPTAFEFSVESLTFRF